MTIKPTCAVCPVDPSDRICIHPDGRGPAFCPTLNKKDVLLETHPDKMPTAEFHMARHASIQERRGYHIYPDKQRRPSKTRLEEIAEFARQMEYTRLGLAFCAGVVEEARRVSEILTSWDFTVISVICKVGCIDKSNLDLTDDFKLNGGKHESMCNPAGQAAVLNSASTDLNIILCLCVGHDSIFMNQSKAPVTVLAAKDRVLSHNPLGAVYTSHSYYRSMKPSSEKGTMPS
jgi:uncharacterized metal-binding protein